MTYTLIPQLWYTITPETDCDLATPNGISIHLPAGIQYFHFADCVSIDISGTATVTQNPPLFKPASASVLGGGYIESNLNVGHGASAAVAAQCTLTPGADLDIGGTLEHDGSVVELEDRFAELDIAVSHPEYGGKLEVTDGDGQTLYTFDVPAAPGDFASIVLTFAQGWELNGIEFALDRGDGGTLELVYSWEGGFSLDAFVEFLNSGAEGSLGDFAEARPWAAGIKVTLKDPAFAGAAGNAVSYASHAMSPFTNEDGETFSGGGENARDLAGLVEAMQDDDAPVEVEVNTAENGVLLTSKVGGAAGAYNVVNAQGGDLWLGVEDVLAIADPRELEDLANAIAEDLTLMQLASASVSEGKVVLTAPTSPTAAEYNNLEYTATGCFGSGTVKQGSATRGKNAVAQTDYEIILNGNQPRTLTPTTAMKNGGVYTVAADIDARTVTLAEHAAATILVSSADGPIPNVQLPAWRWCTEDGLPAKLDYYNVYRIEVVDDGYHTSARLVSHYATEQEWFYKAMTTQAYTAGADINYVQAETNKFKNSGGNRLFNREPEAFGYFSDLEQEAKVALDGSVLDTSYIHGSYTFVRQGTLEFSAAKKLKAIAFHMEKLHGGTAHILFQARDEGTSTWVDATDIMANVWNEKTYFLATVKPSVPSTKKWRIYVDSPLALMGGFRFFEA